MPIASVTDALAQYNANIDWNVNPNHAQAALEAIRYLIVNQPLKMAFAGREITKNLDVLLKEQEQLNTFIGVAPRANGRSRSLATHFSDPGSAR